MLIPSTQVKAGHFGVTPTLKEHIQAVPWRLGNTSLSESPSPRFSERALFQK